MGRTYHWAANKISGLVVFGQSSVLLLPWCGGSVPPVGAKTPAGVARRRLPTRGEDVWGIPPPLEACNLLSSLRHNKWIGKRTLVFLLPLGQSLSTGQ